MPYVAKIIQWNDSAAVELSSDVLKEAHLKIGDQVELRIKEQGILITARPHHHTLSEMIAACDPNAPMPTDLITWQEGPATNKELL